MILPKARPGESFYHIYYATQEDVNNEDNLKGQTSNLNLDREFME
jgi:hypothetical protein